MAGNREDPVIVRQFKIDFQGAIPATGWETVTLPSSLTASNQYFGNTGQGAESKYANQPAAPQYTDLTLTRGVTNDNTVWTWLLSCKEGKIENERKNGSVTLYKQDGTVALTFDFINAWPCTIQTSGSEAGGSATFTESVTITHEGYKRSTGGA